MLERHRMMKFEAWVAGSDKRMESAGCVVDPSLGLCGIAIKQIKGVGSLC